MDHSSRRHRRGAPYHWRDKFPKVSGASRELKDKVRTNWRDFLEKKYLPNSQSETGVQRLPGFAPV